MLTSALALAGGVSPPGVCLGTIEGDVLSYDPVHDDNFIITTDDAGYGDSTLGEQVVAGLERQGHRVTRIGAYPHAWFCAEQLGGDLHGAPTPLRRD